MHDVIVIGRDLSSLIAALKAARAGLKSVLVAEGGLEAEHREGGYGFPLDPIPLSGFGEGQAVLRHLTELGRPGDEFPPLLPQDPALQVILPGHRVDLFQNRERLLADLIREFPHQEREARRFYRSVASAGSIAAGWLKEDQPGGDRGPGRRFQGLLRLLSSLLGRPNFPLREDHGPLRRVIEAQAALLSHLELSGSSFPLCAGYCLSLPEKGLFYPADGPGEWIHWLRRMFADAGGILIEDCTVMRAETEPGIAIDLQGPDRSNTLRGRTLIVSVLWEKLNLLLLEQPPFRRLLRRFARFRPAAYPFCLHMGVREGGLPEKMAPYVLVVPDVTQAAGERNLVFIETSLPGDTKRAPQQRRAVTAAVFLKESPLRLSDPELRERAEWIIASLEGFLPFLRESIDYLHVERSILFSRQNQERFSRKYARRNFFHPGVYTFPPETPLNRVFLTGGMLMAGLGFEGEVLSGIHAAVLAGNEVRDHG